MSAFQKNKQMSSKETSNGEKKLNECIQISHCEDVFLVETFGAMFRFALLPISLQLICKMIDLTQLKQFDEIS